jgi:hypothetical protein
MIKIFKHQMVYAETKPTWKKWYMFKITKHKKKYLGWGMDQVVECLHSKLRP